MKTITENTFKLYEDGKSKTNGAVLAMRELLEKYEARLALFEGLDLRQLDAAIVHFEAVSDDPKSTQDQLEIIRKLRGTTDGSEG
jgi:hypothetical protein